MIDKIDVDEIRRLSAADVPAIKVLLQQFPHIVGFYPKLSNGAIYLLINLLAIMFFLFPIVIGGFAIILTIRLHSLQRILKPQTYAMHKMLHK